MEWLKKDSAMKFIDNINTPGKETIDDDVTAALKKASVHLAEKEAEGKLEWAKFKEPGIYHLLDASKKDLLALDRTKLNMGGYGNIINAVTRSHGPSWRMIVQMSNPTEAWGVYPGGQSGNPGSKFYDDYIDNWVIGKYNKLWFMHDADKTDKNIKWVMKFKKK
jgi:penicillin amidase